MHSKLKQLLCIWEGTSAGVWCPLETRERGQVSFQCRTETRRLLLHRLDFLPGEHSGLGLNLGCALQEPAPHLPVPAFSLPRPPFLSVFSGSS